MPKCRTCSETKEQDEFHRNRRMESGYSNQCKKCALAYKALDYQRHRDKRIKAVKKRSIGKEEQKRQYDREYNKRPDVRKRRAEQRIKWKERNLEKSLALGKVSNHKRRGLTVDKEAKEWMQILLKDPCCYCGEPTEHIDHIQPVASDGDSHWSNLTAACSSCNYDKRAKPMMLWLAER